jgi:NAD(P) transhydrogenase subunit alpha
MRIGIPRETRDQETRVSATPETVKKYVAAGHQVFVEHDAGVAAHFSDEAYAQAGATLATAAQAFDAELILKVRAPSAAELPLIKAGTALAGMLDPFDAEGLDAMAQAGLIAFALEAAPRTTRAQSLDVLSSQANLAGYKAVLLGAQYYGHKSAALELTNISVDMKVLIEQMREQVQNIE